VCCERQFRRLERHIQDAAEVVYRQIREQQREYARERDQEHDRGR
jgi:hypothetical protein